MGECSGNPTFMKEQCARSCGFCTEEDPRDATDAEDDFKDEL